MRGVIFILGLIFFGCSYNLCAQDTPSPIELSDNYHDFSFIDFAEKIFKKHQIQFYFFEGWVNKIKIKQNTAPTTLTDILESSFKNTGVQFFINSNHQVIISYNNTIKSSLSWRAPNEEIGESQVLVPDYSQVDNLFQSAAENYKDEWIIIGDATSPEQKPQVNLTGYIYNQENGEAVEGAIIYIDELQKGTTTDSLGYYQFTLPQGKYQLTYQGIGLKEKQQKIQLFASGRVDVSLGALILNIDEVVISADRKESIRSVQMGVEALKTETIKELPSLLGEVDVIRSALLLPGVQSVGEFSSGINVRGGGADQNLILLNGAPVFNASHLFGFTSSFSSDVVEGFELYKSSIPAKYGGRISSVLEVEMKEGDQERWWLKGGISPVAGRVTLEGPLIKDRASIIISGRSTYADWILDRIEDASIRNSRANYYDGTFRIKTKIAQNDFLDISGYLSNDRFTLNGDSTFAYQNRNLVVNYQHAFSDQLFAVFSGVYSGYTFDVESNKQPRTGFDLNYDINYLEGKAHFSFAASDQHQINFGVNLVNYRLSPGQISPFSSESIVEPQSLESENGLEASLYLSDEWTVTDDLSVSAGLRFTRYMYLGPQTVNQFLPDRPRIEENITGTQDYRSGELIQSYGGPEYRLSLRYAFNENTSVKAAFNRNRQYLSMLFNTATISPTATWKLADNHLLPQTGNQFSLGLFRNFLEDKVEFSLEGYYKIIQNMLDFKAGAELLLNENLETDVINGDGRAYGVEFLVKKNGRRLNGWFSYTYSRTRFRSNSSFVEDQINQGDWFPSNFDKPHDLSFVSYFKASRRFSISTNLTYSTGRPITIPVARYLFSNGLRLQYSRRNEFRVPDYFRWDLSVNLEGNHKRKKLAHSSWSLSLYNVTGRRNVYSIYFVSDGQDAQGYQLSIFGQPFLTLTYNFKI